MPVCVSCGDSATHMHQRHASAEELAAFAADPDNPSVHEGDTDAMVPVYTCDEHKPPPELAGLVHQAGCEPPCTCEPDQPVEQPPLAQSWQ